MKIVNEKFVNTKTYTIDYENGVLCDVKIKDGKLENYKRLAPCF